MEINVRRKLKKIYSYTLNPNWKEGMVGVYKYLIEDTNSNYVNTMWEYLERDWNGEDLTKIINYRKWKEIARDLVFYFNLTEDFIFRYRDSLNWNCVCAWQKLSEEFIDIMKEYVIMTSILENQVLSEDWIRKNSHSFGHEEWYHLSLNRKIKFSEDFMREHKDVLEWTSLCDKQHFTLEFIREMKDKIRISHFNWTIRQMIDKERCNDEFRHINDLANKISISTLTLGDIL